MKKYDGSTSFTPNLSPTDSAVWPDKKACGASSVDRYKALASVDGLRVWVSKVAPMPCREVGIAGLEKGGLDNITEASSSFCNLGESPEK